MLEENNLAAEHTNPAKLKCQQEMKNETVKKIVKKRKKNKRKIALTVPQNGPSSCGTMKFHGNLLYLETAALLW